MVSIFEGVLVEIQRAFRGVGLKYLIITFSIVYVGLYSLVSSKIRFTTVGGGLTGVGSEDPKAES